MSDDVARECGGDDRDSTHRRRARLLLVSFGAVLADRLADAAPAQQVDQKVRADERDRHRDPRRDQETDHVASNTSAATSRSSNGATSSPIACVVSWPLPAMTTTSPGRASPSARAIARRRSGWICTGEGSLM